MEITSIPFPNQEDYYFYNFFQDLHNNNITGDIPTTKRRNLDEASGEDSFLKEILNTISFLDDQDIPSSKFDFDFKIPRSNFAMDSEERVRKTPPPKFDGVAAVDEANSSQHHGGGGPHRLWVKERSKAMWEHYNSDECPDKEFKKVFRMSKAMFNMICGGGGRPVVVLAASGGGVGKKRGILVI